VQRAERLTVELGFASERGRRPRNEDFAAALLERDGDHRGVVAVLADGVGGALGGRVAAELTVRAFLEAHSAHNGLAATRQSAARNLGSINRWVHALGASDAQLAGMACTCTGLILRGRQAHVIHVGDSRLYLWRDGRLQRLTADHVPRGATIRTLTRLVGGESELRIDYAVDAVRQHDRYLLCSDGLYDALSEPQIADALARRATAQGTAVELVGAALAQGASDNVTVLLLDIAELPAANHAELAQLLGVLPLRTEPQPGEVVDDFELRGMLADGRYSRVFEARDVRGERDVIVKFPKNILSAEPALRLAFVREAWIAARVGSPWLCEVIELPPGRQTCLYTVMPHYQGETLEARLLRFPQVSLAGGVDIALKLAKAVTALHRAGVIHRDIKPDNVILVPGAGPKLLDLGVARLPHVEDFPGGDQPGTPSYMAPELFTGAPANERSDQYALAATLFRMFGAGLYPYGEIEPFSRPQFRRRAPLMARRPDLPAWVDQVLRRALAVQPAQRYADVMEFASELERGAIQAAPAPSRPRSLLERDPLRFWQLTSGLLATLLLAAVAYILRHAA
jgi:serine/threonine protein phosphatase PrpC